jgi:nucleoid-associated protein YgaU
MSIQHLFGVAGKVDIGAKVRQQVVILHEVAVPKLYVGQIQALFNPSELRYQRDVSWAIDPISGQTIVAASPRVEFKSASPQTLAIDLFFDTSEGEPQPAVGGFSAPVRPPLLTNPFAVGSPSAVDVSRFTNRVAQLATVWQELHRPPRCQLWWGQYCLIRGVLTNLSEQYSYFLGDGTPVRAVLSCTFTEALDDADFALLPELHSADVPKRRVVRRGDTLSSIAQQEYNDASLWRNIASANHIDDPRGGVTPGQLLLIPSLRAG